MCGRYVLETTTDELARRFKVAPEKVGALFEPRFNIAPTQSIPVVVKDSDGTNRLEQMQWGLIPSWSKEPKAQFSTINARMEGIEDKPAYRKPFRTQRCLVPSTGFYEWRKEGKAKIPYFIHLRSQNDSPYLFALAGLYDIWRSPDGQELKTYTIITTETNDLLRQLHDRMPVILPTEMETIWLDPEINQPDKLLPLLKPYPSELMDLYEVSPRVNSPAHEGYELMAPVEHKPGIYWETPRLME